MTTPVAIICTASHQIGVGHLARCLTLAEDLSSTGFDVRLFVVGDSLLVSFCKNRLDASVGDYDFSVVEHRSKLNLNKILQNNSAIVLDIPNLSADFLQLCLDFSETVLALDYFNFEGPIPSCVVNVFNHSSVKNIANEKWRNNIGYYEGLQYSIIRNEFRNVRDARIKRGEKVDVSRVLLSFGGSDPRGNYVSGLELVKDLPNKVSVDLVLGPFFRGSLDLLSNRSYENLEISVHKSVDCLSELMLNADVVLCGGGGTLLESMTIGVPAVVFQQTHSEKVFAEFVAAHGGCWLAPELHRFEFLSKSLRLAQSLKARNLVDGYGAMRIGKILRQHYSSAEVCSN